MEHNISAEHLSKQLLRATVETCAKAVFRPGFRKIGPNRRVKMGEVPGSYEFDTGELKTFCREVIAAVNAQLGTHFTSMTTVDVSWTYGATVNEIWLHCAQQMPSNATLSLNLVFS